MLLKFVQTALTSGPLSLAQLEALQTASDYRYSAAGAYPQQQQCSSDNYASTTAEYSSYEQQQQAHYAQQQLQQLQQQQQSHLATSSPAFGLNDWYSYYSALTAAAASAAMPCQFRGMYVLTTVT